MDPRFERRKKELLADCQVPPTLFRGVMGRLESFAQPFLAAMPSPESQRHSRTSLARLLSDLECKNAESIAYRYDLDRQTIQRFIGEVPWDHDPLLDELNRQVVCELGRPDAVLVFDPSAFPKKGTASVGVQRQWCGRLGKVDNCQFGGPSGERTTMKTTDFVNDSVVRARLDGLKRDYGGKPFSDIIDDEGHQYVDLVLGGGGTLGVALVGYTYTLEEMGIRFLGLGGTSAGAINAVLLAAAAPPQGERSRLLIPVLADLPCRDFVDSDSNEVCGLVFDWVDKGASFSLIDLLNGTYADAMHHLVRHYGLNPGTKFLAWLSSVLGSFQVRTTRELAARMAQRPSGLAHREGKPLSDSQAAAHLALVATEVTTESKIVFPEMSCLFWDDPDQVDPAIYVRASMSIPFFYQPLRLEIPRGPQAIANWGALAKYTDPLPGEGLLVDGGVMSNFPIDLFHLPEEVPAAPTFGVKLGKDQRRNRVDTAAGLVWAIFNSARHCLDRDFLAHHPDYRYLVATVDTAGHSWLQFDMSDKEKLDLFRHGVEAAATFLEGFNWEQYKRVRKGLKQAAVEVARPSQAVLQPVTG